MSRRRICYWPGQTDWGRDWLFLNLGASDEDLNVARYSPTQSRYSPTPSRYSPTPSRYSPHRIASPSPSSCCCTYHRPWRYTPAVKSGFSKIQESKDSFKVTLDVKHFKDGDLKVKVVGNQVVVEAQHEERQDEFGFISRSLKRKYSLPEDVDAENVKTELSSDGILTIIAPRKKDRTGEGTERLIPIVKSNKPALTSKKKKQEPKVRPSRSRDDRVIDDAAGSSDAEYVDADDGDNGGNDSD